MPETEQADLTTLTVELLSAFVSNNTIESSDLAGLIQSTHTALVAINAPSPVEPPAPEFEPAVTVRKSLGSRDHILRVGFETKHLILRALLRGERGAARMRGTAMRWPMRWSARSPWQGADCD